MSENFNFIPLLMWISISLQYWTYHNQTYNTQSREVVGDFIRTYQFFLRKFVTAITIVYYKCLVPVTYVITLVLILMETFSVTSAAVLIWTLLIFICEHSGVTKSILHRMWKAMSVMLAVMIVIRYFFEFTKFPTVYKIFSKIPMFEFLYEYQLLLGLSVDNSAQNYFHAISKFQLMIALDFVQLLLTYLVIDYYAVIIKYYDREGLDPLEKERVEEIYLNYISFKLQDITRTITKLFRGLS